MVMDFEFPQKHYVNCICMGWDCMPKSYDQVRRVLVLN
jgi:hypothetical protein